MPEKCTAYRCTAWRRDGQVFCKRHWFSLPKPLRDAIWDAHRRKDRKASIANIMEAVRLIRESEVATGGDLFEGAQ